MRFRFMVPYIVMITLNKNANYMYFVLKSLKIFYFTLFCSTCFRHHCVHHQELLSCTCSLWSHVVDTGGHNEPSSTRDQRLYVQLRSS